MTRPTTWWLTSRSASRRSTSARCRSCDLCDSGKWPDGRHHRCRHDPRRRRRRLRGSVGLGPIRGFYIQDPTRRRRRRDLGRYLRLQWQRRSVNLGDVVLVSGTRRRISGPDADQRNLVFSLRHRNGGPGGRDAATAVCRTHWNHSKACSCGCRRRCTSPSTSSSDASARSWCPLAGDLTQPTRRHPPGPDADALQAANNLNRLIIDDDTNVQNPDPIAFGRVGQPLSASNTLRGGDTTTGIVGVMTYTWAGNTPSGNAFRVRPIGSLTGTVSFAPANPRPPAPRAQPGRFASRA